MSYEITAVLTPGTIDEDQEMWVAQISYIDDGWEDDGIAHNDCIEVRAENMTLLDKRTTKIIEALNENG